MISDRTSSPLPRTTIRTARRYQRDRCPGRFRHDHHEAIAEALADRRLGLSGHAAFETYSVLTRLPTLLRRTPRAAGQPLANNFPGSRFLNADAAARLLVRLSALESRAVPSTTPSWVPRPFNTGFALPLVTARNRHLPQVRRRPRDSGLGATPPRCPL